MGDVFANIVYDFRTPILVIRANFRSDMPVDALKPLIEALLAQLPDDPSSVVITVKSETDSPQPTNGQKPTSTGPIYDPAMVYILELCTVLALRDSKTIEAVGADVAEALQNVMRHSQGYHSIMISRTMLYLLHLLRASYVSTCGSLKRYTADFCRNTTSSVFQLSSTQYQASRRIYSGSQHHSSCKA